MTVEPSLFFREVVTGQRHWSDLSQLGIVVRVEDGEVTITEPEQLPELVIAPYDIVQGLRTLRANDEELRVWAAIVRGIADVETFVDTPEGEQLLDLLWDIAFGEEVTDQEIDEATRAWSNS